MRRRFYKLSKLKGASKAEAQRALNHMRQRAESVVGLKEAAEKLDRGVLKTDAAVRERVKFIQQSFDAGRVTKDEFIFFAAQPIEMYHEHQWLEGAYDDELGPLSAATKKIEEAHGLREDQYWKTKDAPEEHRAITREYDRVLDARLGAAMRAYAPIDVLYLFEARRAEFEERRERGRRATVNKDDYVAAVLDLVGAYEADAQLCAKSGAYYGAIALLGAACEARLLLVCLRKAALVSAARERLDASKRPKSSDPRRWTFEQLVEIVSEAGLLPALVDDDIAHRVSAWMTRLRTLRNSLHPGRHIMDAPHVRLEEPAYNDASAAYTALVMALGRRANVRL